MAYFSSARCCCGGCGSQAFDDEYRVACRGEAVCGVCRARTPTPSSVPDAFPAVAMCAQQGVPSFSSPVRRHDRGGNAVQQDGASAAQGVCSKQLRSCRSVRRMCACGIRQRKGFVYVNGSVPVNTYLSLSTSGAVPCRGFHSYWGIYEARCAYCWVSPDWHRCVRSGTGSSTQGDTHSPPGRFFVCLCCPSSTPCHPCLLYGAPPPRHYLFPRLPGVRSDARASLGRFHGILRERRRVLPLLVFGACVPSIFVVVAISFARFLPCTS